MFKYKKTISVAESCTGGLICHALTNISGSSKYFKLGLVLYSNATKSDILHIKPEDIARWGAVSERIAKLMAERVRRFARTDLGISTTGIAGPTGGTKIKPIGTVYIALANKKSTFVEKFKFSGSRTQIKNQAKNKALFLIKKCLKNQ